ncbi:hypothetical protein D3C71_2114710 [compost metagenome]
MKIRPFRLRTAGPSLTLNPMVSQSYSGFVIIVCLPVSVQGLDISEMYRLEFPGISGSFCAQT